MTAVLAASAALPLLVFAARALTAFSLIPASDMNASHVATSVALARGWRIYLGSRDDGPILDFMYGPLTAIAFLPSTLASSLSAMLLVGGLLTLVYFFGPMAWLHLGSRAGPAAGAAGLACFALLVFRDPALSYSGFYIHADAPALGLAACACKLLLVSRERASSLAHVGSAACAVLAAWTKQTAAPIVLALPLWVLLADGGRAALRYTASLALVGSIVALVFAVSFGVEPLVFNMLVLPSRHPWHDEATHGKLGTALFWLRILAVQNRWPAALLAAAALLGASGARGLRAWCGANPWTLLLLTGLLMVPTSVMGSAKVGGYLNSHSFASYFLLGAATLGLTEAARAGARSSRLAKAALAGLALALAASDIVDRSRYEALRVAIGRLGSWSDNPQTAAYEFARAHPGEVYLPWNPLASLLADGVLYHSDFGIWDRELAGQPPADDLWRQHLPPRMRFVAFRSGIGRSLPSPTRRLPEFTARVAAEELPRWEVYERR
jgi:hypothetical protein